MVNLISLRELVRYDSGSRINLIAERIMRENVGEFVHVPELAPSRALEDFWKKSSQTEEDWSVFAEIYKFQMNDAAARIQLLVIRDLDSLYDTVNVVFYESDPKRSHRTFLLQYFDDLEIPSRLV